MNRINYDPLNTRYRLNEFNVIRLPILFILWICIGFESIRKTRSYQNGPASPIMIIIGVCILFNHKQKHKIHMLAH